MTLHRVYGVLNAVAALPLLLAAAAAGAISLGMGYAAYTAGRLIHQGWDAPRGEARRALWACVSCIVPLAAATAIVLGQQDLVARLNNFPAPLLLFLFVMDAIALTHISRGRPVAARTR